MYPIKLNSGIKSVVGYVFIEQKYTMERQNVFGTLVECISRILPDMEKPVIIQNSLSDSNVFSDS
jgi:hypothetical protein